MITIQQQKRCFEGSFAFGLMLGLLVLPAAASNNRQVFVRLTYDFSRFEVEVRLGDHMPKFVNSFQIPFHASLNAL